jgi:hypothetical protein
MSAKVEYANGVDAHNSSNGKFIEHIGKWCQKYTIFL